MANEDGNTAQWDKLKAARGGETTPVKVIEPTPPADGSAPPPDGTKTLPEHGPDGKFVAKVPEVVPPAVETSLVVATSPAETPPPAVVEPTSVEIEIDGQKVMVDPSLAAAFTAAEKVKTENAKVNDRETLKSELRDELRKELAPPPKSVAEIAADRALADAEALAKLPKMPAADLAITDPAQYNKDLEAYIEGKTLLAADRAKKDTLADVNVRNAEAIRQNEIAARATLGEQFYNKYPVLRKSKELVDILMNKKFDDVVASGKLATPPTPAEAEKLKDIVFAEIAADATRKVVGLMGTSRAVTPPPPPPATVHSAPPTPKPAEPAEVKSRADKFPAGSVSAALAAQRKAKAA